MKSHTSGAYQPIGPVHGYNCAQHNLHREYDHDVVQVLDIPTRNSIPESRRCKGMYVLVLSDRTFYRLVNGLTNDDWVACGKNEISADYLPNASKTQKGVVQIGDNINVDANGLIAVPVATANILGVVKGGDNVNIAADGTLSVETTGGFTTMETLTTSQTWTVPKTGYYRVTCIGGGGGGGAGGTLMDTRAMGKAGIEGGTTTFGLHVSATGGEGGPGGGGCSWPVGGAGGGAGKITTKYIFLTAGTIIAVLIGAGGAQVSGSDPYIAALNSARPVPPIGTTPAGANASAYVNWNIGGNGAMTGLGYGGGGGGGGGSYGKNEGGQATDGANNGGPSGGTPVNGTGGKGGDGAVIIEY